MAQPAIQSSNPSNNAVDVFLNIPLYVTFASPGLDSSTVTINTCALLNVGTQDTLPVSLSYNSTTFVLTLTPVGVLAENTVYKIRFPGTDIAISSDYVIKESGSGDALTTTLDITFTTGTRIYLDDTIITKEATNLSLEGDITLPTHVKALGPFAIDSTIPKNHKSDVPVNIDGNNRIRIKFTKSLSGSLSDDSWVDVDLFPILDYSGFYATGTVLWDTTGANNIVASIPTMTGLSFSGQYMYLNFDTSLPKNAGVAVTIGESVTATDGTEFGPNEYQLTFTTERYPSLGGVHWLKTELKSMAKELTDDYLAAVLLKNSIRLYHRLGAGLGPPPIPLISHKWVILTSVIDILDDLDLAKAIVAGARRNLGDMNVSFDVAIGQMTLKQKRAEKELESTNMGMFLSRYYQRYERAIYVENRPNPREWFNISGRIYSTRFLYYQPNSPMSNVTLNRLSKNINPWYFI